MLAARHHSSGADFDFVHTQLSFADYVVQIRQMIAKTRAHLAEPELTRAIEGNAPFQLSPSVFQPGATKTYQRGIVLTHGLSDSPYFMRYLGAFFQEQGFRVMAVLLPGHGTQPGDLLETHWESWLKMVAYGAERMALEVEEIYLGGYSAGAALSTLHALSDDRIKGLFLFSPAFEISSRAAWAHAHKLYSWLLTEAKWLDIKADSDLYKYESFPKNAAAQMYALTQVLKSRLGEAELSVPVFAAVSQDDVTIHAEAVERFMSALNSPHKKLIYYFSDASKLPQKISLVNLECVKSVISEKNILSSAHTAITLPPEDTHYGERGEYRNCSHYEAKETEKYQACKRNEGELMFGELTQKNLGAGTMARLMYNPNFAALKNSLSQFIEELPK